MSRPYNNIIHVEDTSYEIRHIQNNYKHTLRDVYLKAFEEMLGEKTPNHVDNFFGKCFEHNYWIEINNLHYSYCTSGGSFNQLCTYIFNEDPVTINIMVNYIDCSKETWEIDMRDPKSFEYIKVIFIMLTVNCQIDRKCAIPSLVRQDKKTSWIYHPDRLKISIPEGDWSLNSTLTEKEKEIILKYQNDSYKKSGIIPILPKYFSRV